MTPQTLQHNPAPSQVRHTGLSTGHSTTRSPGRLVTDAPTRMFHLLLALSFTGAYLTAESEHWRALHVALGYALAGVLALRVAYGAFGPRTAQLGSVFRKLAAAPAWLRTAAGAARRLDFAALPVQQAQHLLMALAIVLILLLAVPLVFTGYANYNEWGDVLGGDLWSEVHEFFAETLLMVVLGHVALIIGLSLLRRKNQARRMFGGRVEGAGPDLVKNNRRWLAIVLLLAWAGLVLAMGFTPPGPLN